MAKGLVAFSFGLRSEKDEPNPCNFRLALEVKRIIEADDEEIVIVAQWEIAKALNYLGIQVETIVELEGDGSYLDSEMVWQIAHDVFYKRSAYEGWISEIIPVAQPFLHMSKVKKLIRESGYRVIDPKIGLFKIGFDRISTQWWTRGPLHLLFYALLRFGLRGHGGKQWA